MEHIDGLIEVFDLSHPGLDAYLRLTGAQMRSKIEPEKGIFIAESPTVIEVALKSGCEPVSLLCDKRLINTRAAQTIALCREKVKDLPVYCGERELLASMTGFALTRGMLAAMKRPPRRSAEELCRGARRIAVLENVVDSTNIGAILRSAAGIGIDAVLLTPTCCDPLCRRAIRVSMGTVFQVPWGYIGKEDGWPEGGMARLKQYGFRTVAMALSEGAIPIDDERIKQEEKLAILLGAEGDGLAKETIASCDYTAIIPMLHGVDSLNVAAASAVAFWELRPKESKE